MLILHTFMNVIRFRIALLRVHYHNMMACVVAILRLYVYVCFSLGRITVQSYPSSAFSQVSPFRWGCHNVCFTLDVRDRTFGSGHKSILILTVVFVLFVIWVEDVQRIVLFTQLHRIVRSLVGRDS